MNNQLLSLKQNIPYFYMLQLNYLSSIVHKGNQKDFCAAFKDFFSDELIDNYTLSSTGSWIAVKQRSLALDSLILYQIWLDLAKNKFGSSLHKKMVADVYAKNRVSMAKSRRRTGV